jgi:hypothetical protein
VLSALREVQIPLLAVLLLSGCGMKARRALSARDTAIMTSPTVLFPLHLRRPLGIALCAGELSLGVALLVTAGPFGAGVPAMVVRSLATLLFAMGVGALHELRGRRPEAGCGCFGELSHAPVSSRVMARAALLAIASLGTVTAGPLRGLTPLTEAWVLLGMVLAEVAVLVALSPEIGEVMVRLGYSEPCELRRIPVTRTLAALRGSAHWRRYRRYLTDTEPSDVWRETCWRYAVFPGIADGRVVDVVFAVYMKPRRPTIRATIVDSATDQELASLTIPFQRSAPPSSAHLYGTIKESQY